MADDRRPRMATLTSMQSYAAGALLALALRQVQLHQSLFSGDRRSSGASSTTIGGESEADGDEMWIHESHGLLRPVFRYLEIDSKAWAGLEETAATSIVKHHVGAYIRMIFEDDFEDTPEKSEQKLALAKAVDAMVMNLETDIPSERMLMEQHRKEEHESHNLNVEGNSSEFSHNLEDKNTKGLYIDEELLDPVHAICGEALVIEDTSYNYQKKVALLYELLSSCVADTPEEKKKSSKIRKGYDARHRVALRLLATWLDVKWIKVEAMEIMIACSAMDAVKNEIQQQEGESEEDQWAKWKRNGIIGAAALTGGALMAITGGLAAPAIAAGFGALAPTLGTLVPIVGAGGFAAMASAAGSVAGSVAVAASFGAAGAGLSGSKMARRTADIEEFEFKPIGENHNQGRLGVGIMISGFVFDEEDFIKPWEGWEDNLERYVLQWESKNLITVSTAIQDWLTSKLTTELMRQGAMMTVLSSLVAALAWPTTLLSATNFIDSTWSIAIDRSDKAGKLLAEVLLKGLQGNRPVTLIGFSLGARVIFKCLEILASSGYNEGLVERVVLLGAPISVKGEQWEIVRKIVAGRFINAYSTNDWILGVTFRASLLTQGLAGIQPVDIAGIQNVDVTDFIDGHSSYMWTVRDIVEQLELDTYYPVFNPLPVSSQQELDF